MTTIRCLIASPHPALRATAQVVLASLFLGLCAQIRIPLGFTPVPVTGQTLGIIAIGAALGSRKGMAAAILYLVQGALGCPVWAGGSAGFIHLVGPTGGYLLSYPLETFLIGFMLERNYNILLAILVPCLVQLGLGSLWLSMFVGAGKMLTLGFYPFVGVEAAKAAFVSLCLTCRGKKQW